MKKVLNCVSLLLVLAIMLTFTVPVTKTLGAESYVEITNIAASSGAEYQVGRLEVGSRQYSNSNINFVYTEVPSKFIGMKYIMTSYNDSYRNDASFLKFKIDTPANVYVVYDNRAPIPAWMLQNSFKDSGFDFADPNWPRGASGWVKRFEPGIVTLGGNEFGGGMYNVIVEPVLGTAVNISGIYAASGAKYAVNTLEVGSPQYTDAPTSLTYTYVPPEDIGAQYIITSYDDSFERNKDFLRFDINTESTVIVTLDKRLPLPRWMVEAGFRNTGRVYRDPAWPSDAAGWGKVYPAGTVILGGNEFGGGMYDVIVKPGNELPPEPKLPATTNRPVNITNITSATGEDYKIGPPLNERSPQYTNWLNGLGAKFSYTSVPSKFVGVPYIMTSYNDSSRKEDKFLTFNIDRASNIYVVFDNRSPLPTWMVDNKFTDSGFDFEDPNWPRGASGWVKSFPAGTVTLGGNEFGGGMYNVIVQGMSGTTNITDIVAASGAAYKVNNLGLDQPQYIDGPTDLTFTYVPPEFIDSQYIVTSYNDSFVNNNSALSFDVDESVVVYIILDENLPIPQWAIDEGYIATNYIFRDPAWPVNARAWAKVYPASSIKLGGNQFGGGMYDVVVRPLY